MKTVYYCEVRNAITRRSIIKALIKKGYCLYYPWTEKDYAVKWPPEDCPFLVVELQHYSNGQVEGRITLAPAIDWIIKGEDEYPTIRMKLSNVLSLPDIHKANKYESPETKPKIVFPEAAKYDITYITQSGEQKSYTVSNPLVATDQSITTYAFGKGIRTFLKKFIVSFKKVSP